MRLDHVNLAVPDVAASRAFFEGYFGFRCLVAGKRNEIAVMQDGSGFVLTLSNFDGAAEVSYPGAFHVGFGQEGREQVDAMYARLKADGLAGDPPREFHGAWTFYFRAPGGVVVEVYHQHKTLGPR